MSLNNSSTIAAAMLNHLWQSTLFAAAIAALAWVLRAHQARIRYRLWLAASAKFLVPFWLLTKLGERLATLSHPPGAQPLFYLLFRNVGQPFSPSASIRGWLLETLLTYGSGALVLVWLGGVIYSFKSIWFRWRRVMAAVHGAAILEEGREVQALRRVELVAGTRRPIVFRLSA